MITKKERYRRVEIASLRAVPIEGDTWDQLI
jgi:hypothetical protein